MILRTVGYQRQEADYIDTLVEWLALDGLLDVRLTSRSTRVEYTGEALAARITCYEHLPELGNTAKRPDAPWAPLNPVQAEFSLGRIAKRIEQGQRLMLLCVCPDAKLCHRGQIAHRLNQMLGGRLEVRHYL